jgi:hypothetical protein
MNYTEQYKHPKWQKRRLNKMDSVMKFYDKDTPCCEWCYNDEEQLHIHHKEYVKNRDIWDYKDDELLVLCESCHKDIHAMNNEIKSLIAGMSDMAETFQSVRSVLFLMSRFGFPSITYIDEILIAVLRSEGKYKAVSEHKKMLEKWLKDS